jgi:predicted ATPase
MLTRLRIRNFKNWADTGDIRLAPITVFFGTNSSGKSSLIQFVLMLRQTAESPDRLRVLHPGDENTPVELGTFRDLIFQHSLANSIGFEVEWKLPEPLEVADSVGSEKYDGEAVSFKATVAFDTKASTPRVASLEYQLKGSPDLTASMKPAAANGGGHQYELSAYPYNLRRNQGRAWKLPAPVRFYGFPEEVRAYYQNADFTSDLALSLEQELRRVQYLGPLRTVPKRSYIWSGEIPAHVGWAGDRAIEALLAAGERKIASGPKKWATPFQAIIARWLQEMGLLDNFEVRQIAENRREYEVLVLTRNGRTPVTLPDVGFGVSQVLPVIVECFYAQPHATVLLEQPEIHLHPSVQMTLADLFIETVNSREDGKERNIQLIVESHSEHFLRRLQRRIAEGNISPDRVALYFCRPTPFGASLDPLKLTPGGDIENWPEDFFGDDMAEITARLDAATQSPRKTD